MKIFFIILINLLIPIKFIIKFQMALSRNINIWYVKNNNYRFILKQYSTFLNKIVFHKS